MTTEFLPELWTNKLNEMLSKTMVSQCTNNNYEGEISDQGDSVTVANDEELVIDQKKFFAFKINDIAAAQANSSIMEAHLEGVKRAVCPIQEEYLFKYCQAPTNNWVGSPDVPFELDSKRIFEDFVRLALMIKSQKDCTNPQRPWVIINPQIETYLLQSSGFIKAKNIADNAMREGAIGRIAGMDVFVSYNLEAENGVYRILAGTNEAITFASQIVRIENLSYRDDFFDLVRGLYVYGAKTVNPKNLAAMFVKIKE